MTKLTVAESCMDRGEASEPALIWCNHHENKVSSLLTTFGWIPKKRTSAIARKCRVTIEILRMEDVTNARSNVQLKLRPLFR